MYQLQNFDLTYFLDKVWQQQPMVFKGVFPDFVDPLSADELAGLAQEEEVDARIISCHQQQWYLSHGPFDDFESLCVGQWSLLVQAVDAYLPEADALMQAFDFIPNWRIDDLMISYSSPGAGVGPHLDQYDVFIIQGKGSRRWQVGSPGHYQALTPHPQLAQIKSFEPVIDEILQPGDMIYIPPGHPHNGVAEDYCMNYSVGCRASTAAELLSSFSDHVLERDMFKQRYQDPDLTPRESAGEISTDEINTLRKMLINSIESAQFADFILESSSHNHALDAILETPERFYSEAEILTLIQQGVVFYRHPGLRPTWSETQQQTDKFVFFIQGQRFDVVKKHKKLALTVTTSAEWQISSRENNENCLFFTQLLTKLVNSGFWCTQDQIE